MKKIIKYILLIFWMGLIFSFSNQPAIESDVVSDGVMAKVINIVEKITNYEFSDNQLNNIYEYGIGPLRKCAHLTIYFILGMLFYLVLKEYNLNDKKLIALSIICSIIYACSDEIHQLFIIGRSGEFKDVIIDTLGSILGILVIKKSLVIYEKVFKHK